MNRRVWIWSVVTALLMAGTAFLLAELRGRQRLGESGVRTRPIPGETLRVEVELPEVVPGYRSEPVAVQQEVVEALPADTSFGQRIYRGEDGFELLLNVVLMGTDRTSIHKPQFCLVGAGWRIDETVTDRIRIPRPHPYDLPVVKLLTSREMTVQGRAVPVRGVYVYWFVCGDGLSGEPTGWERMWWMARELVTRGVLQRWAYVTCFAVCAPGREEATYERMKAFLAEAVPEFQTVPGPPAPVAAGNQEGAQ
ncbi:exosortase-associated EpsI family protein [Limisphaera sp. 4302-co]|uniref:exosortase-associated EpsI family protein n=1 Tax=Limisphaera sp. 4302-co TaxID=3400417 RepID=UPI003C296D59